MAGRILQFSAQHLTAQMPGLEEQTCGCCAAAFVLHVFAAEIMSFSVKQTTTQLCMCRAE
jgi:hypothetical protein